jgi:hypothetical protein
MCDHKGEPRTGVRGCAFRCTAAVRHPCRTPGHCRTRLAPVRSCAGGSKCCVTVPPPKVVCPRQQSAVSPSPVTPPQPHAARPFFLRVFASSREKKHAPAAPREAAKGTARGLLNVYPCRTPRHCRTRFAPGRSSAGGSKCCVTVPPPKWCVPVNKVVCPRHPSLPLSRTRLARSSFASSRLRVRKNTPLLLHAKLRREPHGDS